jgi:hypothetical protein
MLKCHRCVNQNTVICLNCRDSEQVQKILDVLPKTSRFQNYIPACPRGYTDCIHDPAYIKFYHEEWYRKLYGDISPEEIIYKTNGCYTKFINDPDEQYYCYDNEDK